MEVPKPSPEAAHRRLENSTLIVRAVRSPQVLAVDDAYRRLCGIEVIQETGIHSDTPCLAIQLPSSSKAGISTKVEQP